MVSWNVCSSRWGPHPIFLLSGKQWQHIIDPHWMSTGKMKNYLPSICGSGWLLALEREKPSYIATLTHTSAPGLPCGLKSLSFEQNFGLKHCIPKKHTHATESRITGKRGGEGDLCLGFIQHLIDTNTKVSKHPWSDCEMGPQSSWKQNKGCSKSKCQRKHDCVKNVLLWAPKVCGHITQGLKNTQILSPELFRCCSAAMSWPTLVIP